MYTFFFFIPFCIVIAFLFFMFMFLWAVYCLYIVCQLATFTLCGVGFRRFVVVCAVLKLRFPAQGILRDFQGQYYSLILILYKFCAVSISLLCGDRTVSVSYDYVYTVLFGIVCLFLSFWRDIPPPVGQGLLIHEVSRLHTTTRHIR